jgi:hypothetical protein
VKSATTREFWGHYHQLASDSGAGSKEVPPLEWGSLASFARFKKVGGFWRVRIGEGYRALGYREGEYLVWVWIGTHDEYLRLIKAKAGR